MTAKKLKLSLENFSAKRLQTVCCGKSYITERVEQSSASSSLHCALDCSGNVNWLATPLLTRQDSQFNIVTFLSGTILCSTTYSQRPVNVLELILAALLLVYDFLFGVLIQVVVDLGIDYLYLLSKNQPYYTLFGGILRVFICNYLIFMVCIGYISVETCQLFSFIS